MWKNKNKENSTKEATSLFPRQSFNLCFCTVQSGIHFCSPSEQSINLKQECDWTGVSCALLYISFPERLNWPLGFRSIVIEVLLKSAILPGFDFSVTIDYCIILWCLSDLKQHFSHNCTRLPRDKKIMKNSWDSSMFLKLPGNLQRASWSWHP